MGFICYKSIKKSKTVKIYIFFLLFIFLYILLTHNIFHLKRVFICLSIVFSSFFCFGQNEVIQFSGLVVETFSREPTSFCAVYKKNSDRGTIADDQGFFSLVVEKGDTIMFQCLGYKPKYIVVPSTVQNNSFIQTVLMETDAINLKELVIRPLPAPNLLRAAIVNVDVPDDFIALAEETFNNSQLDDWTLGTKYDGTENFNLFVDKTVANNYSLGQARPQKLFDIASWAQFAKALKDGAFKKKDDE